MFTLKKVYLAVLTAFMFMAMPLNSLAAVTNTTIKSDKDTVMYSYDSEIFTEYKISLMPVIGDWEISAEGYVSRDITVEFAKEGTGTSELYLRLDADTADMVNFFKFRFVSPTGEILYDDLTDSNPANENYREIYLTNSDKPMEFKLEYTVTDGVDRNIDIASLKLSVVSRGEKTAVATVAPTEKPVPTQKPRFDLDSLDNGRQDIVFDLADGTIKGPDISNEEKKVIKTVGVDIPADRYAVNGNGKLQISSANGMIKYESNITDATGTTVVLLENGDVIKITATDGGDSARLSFSKVAADATTPGTVNNEAEKTNPKTDDASLGVGVTVGVLVLVAGAVVGLELLKRKKSDNN